VRLAEALVEKQRVADQALDAPLPQPEPLPEAQPDPEMVGRALPLSSLAREGQAIAEERRALLREALRQLAADDPDRAARRNDAGFSASDSTIGHRLAATWPWSDAQAAVAARLVRRYHRQLPEELVVAARP
jgi:hypothetical protein